MFVWRGVMRMHAVSLCFSHMSRPRPAEHRVTGGCQTAFAQRRHEPKASVVLQTRSGKKDCREEGVAEDTSLPVAC